jgi:hypothetical protein
MRRALVLGVILIGSSTARAHIGAVVANARFTSPATPMVTAADAGVLLAPFTVESVAAGAPVTVTWEDGDNDPTGRFYFYYIDHCPSFDVPVTDIESTLATAIPDGNGVWASCVCNPDAGMGVTCPDAGPTGRDCRNAITWDTTSVPTGTYWIVAVNNDPPYHVYSVSGSPVQVTAAGDQTPPAAIVLRPDGYNAYDKSYRVQWFAVGTPPLKFDLAYGIEDPALVLGPTTSLGTNVQGFSDPDGTWSWDWDISSYTNLGVFFLRVTVTDGNGKSTYTDSRFGLSVFHPSLDGGPPDLSKHPTDMLTLKPPPHGCEVAPGGEFWTLLAPFGAAFALLIFVRRLRRR